MVFHAFPPINPYDQHLWYCALPMIEHTWAQWVCTCIVQPPGPWRRGQVTLGEGYCQIASLEQHEDFGMVGGVGMLVVVVVFGSQLWKCWWRNLRFWLLLQQEFIADPEFIVPSLHPFSGKLNICNSLLSHLLGFKLLIEWKIFLIS